MKRYLVFAGYDYYPSGGWDDFQSDHETAEEAHAAVRTLVVKSHDWYQVVDLETGGRA